MHRLSYARYWHILAAMHPLSDARYLPVVACYASAMFCRVCIAERMEEVEREYEVSGLVSVCACVRRSAVLARCTCRTAGNVWFWHTVWAGRSDRRCQVLT
eukprot:503804-Rhodomonas_salina.4